MKIQIQPLVISNWHDSSITELRIFASRAFTTSTGENIPQGSPDSGIAYKSITCSYSPGASTLTIPQFIIDSTTDSPDFALSRYSAFFYDSNGNLKLHFDGLGNFAVPGIISSSSGCTPSGGATSCCTWAELRIYNSSSLALPVDGFYTRSQIDRLLAAVSAGAVVWGAITGTLSNQSDLQSTINARVPNTRTINTTSPLSGGGNLVGDLTLSLADTAVVPGSFTNANITVDQKGRLTSAASGSGGGTVTSVFGRSGAVVAASNDYTWAQVNKATSSLADITTRSASDLSSGILPLGRLSGITNTEIAAGAGIVYSKLSLTGAILNTDLAGSIADTKLLSISTAGKVSDSALSSNVPLKNASNIFATTNEFRQNGLAATQVNALFLNNQTAALVGVQTQNSPVLQFSGAQWNNSTVQSDSYDLRMFQTGDLNPSNDKSRSWLSIQAQKNGGGFVEVAKLSPDGIFGTSIGTTQGAAGDVILGGPQLLFLDPTGEDYAQFIIYQKNVFGDTLDTELWTTDYVRFNDFNHALGTTIYEIANTPTEDFLTLYGYRLTTGGLFKGVIPATGFTGDLIKITDDAGSPVTKFRVTAGGVIITGTGPTTLTDTTGKILSAALNTVAVAQGGTGITSFGTGVATFLGTPSSANLLAAITDETGSGLAVFNSSPTIITPSFTTGFTIGGAAASRKMIVGNGTNFVASTETWAVPGTTGNVLTSDGTNWTSAAPAAAGANAALSNLASVSINTSLLAQTGVDLGSTTLPFRDLYLFGGGTFATTYLKLTGTPTSTRTVTFPDNTGTVAELNFAQTWSANQTFGSGNLLATSPVFTTNITTPVVTNAGAISITTTASNGDINLTPNGSGNIVSGRSFNTTVAGQAYIAGTDNNTYKIGIDGGTNGRLRINASSVIQASSTSNANDTSDVGLSRISAGLWGMGTGAAGSFAGNLKLTDLTAVGNLIVSTAGKGLQLQSGTGARSGDATLVGGTITVTNTTVTANTKIILTRHTAGGTLGMALTYTVSAGASFTITSDNILDTSTITYLLIEVN